MRYKKLIEIDIDLLTQCLIRTKDNKIVKTEVKEFSSENKLRTMILRLDNF